MNREQFKKSLMKSLYDLSDGDLDFSEGGCYIGRTDINSVYPRSSTMTATSELVSFEISFPGCEDTTCTAHAIEVPTVTYKTFTVGYVLLIESKTGRVLYSGHTAWVDDPHTAMEFVAILAATALIAGTE